MAKYGKVGENEGEFGVFLQFTTEDHTLILSGSLCKDLSAVSAASTALVTHQSQSQARRQVAP